MLTHLSSGHTEENCSSAVLAGLDVVQQSQAGLGSVLGLDEEQLVLLDLKRIIWLINESVKNGSNTYILFQEDIFNIFDKQISQTYFDLYFEYNIFFVAVNEELKLK